MFLQFVYAHNFDSLKKNLWNDLEDDAYAIYKLWIILKDFNCIRLAKEKLAGNSIPFLKLGELDTWIIRLGTTEMHIQRFNFSQWSGLENNSLTKIDRVFTNVYWMQTFSNSSVNYLSSGVSNHYPIIVSQIEKKKEMMKPFKYTNHQPTIDEYQDIVNQGWKLNAVRRPPYQLLHKLKAIKCKLKNQAKDKIELAKRLKSCAH